MEQSIRLSSKSKLRGNKQKAKEKELSIEKAYFLGGHTILLFFNTGVQKQLNFLPIFSKHLKGEYQEYSLPRNFKKFIVANGNIYWGKNEEVIFPVSFLFNNPYSKKLKEEVVLVI